MKEKLTSDFYSKNELLSILFFYLNWGNYIDLDVKQSPNSRTLIRIPRISQRVYGEINCMCFEVSKEYEKNYPTRNLTLNTMFFLLKHKEQFYIISSKEGLMYNHICYKFYNSYICMTFVLCGLISHMLPNGVEFLHISGIRFGAPLFIVISFPRIT